MTTQMSHSLRELQVVKPKKSRLISPYTYPGLVSGSVRAPSVKVQPQVICDCVARRTAQFFGFKDVSELKAKTRKHTVVSPRQMAMYFIRKKGVTLVETAEYFGMDHSTVVHGCALVSDRIEAEVDFRETVTDLEEYIRINEYVK